MKDYTIVVPDQNVLSCVCGTNDSNLRRIEEHFPELTDIFDGYTIRDLFNLANNRKETRHYIKDKATVSAHESLTEEERIKMFNCTFSLMINVLREKFGLSRVPFEFF